MAHKGLLEYEDLAEWHATVEQPVSLEYDGLDVHKCPSWTQGPLFLQQLAILKTMDVTDARSQLPRLPAYMDRVREARIRRPRGILRRPRIRRGPHRHAPLRRLRPEARRADRRSRIPRTPPRRSRRWRARLHRHRSGRGQPHRARRGTPAKSATSASDTPTSATPPTSTQWTQRATWSLQPPAAAGSAHPP